MLNNFRFVPKSGLRAFGSKLLNKNFTRALYNLGPNRSFSHIKDLNQVMWTALTEEEQRKDKFLEYTHKVYKPSNTITFDRNGECLLFSVDNFKNSQVYLKYPYCMYDAMIPLAVYLFFCDPCKNNIYNLIKLKLFCNFLVSLSWQFKHAIFHTAWILGWMPHYLYIRSLSKKIRKIYLMRGGKYCRIEMMDWMGV